MCDGLFTWFILLSLSHSPSLSSLSLSPRVSLMVPLFKCTHTHSHINLMGGWVKWGGNRTRTRRKNSAREQKNYHLPRTKYYHLVVVTFVYVHECVCLYTYAYIFLSFKNIYIFWLSHFAAYYCIALHTRLPAVWQIVAHRFFTASQKF